MLRWKAMRWRRIVFKKKNDDGRWKSQIISFRNPFSTQSEKIQSTNRGFQPHCSKTLFFVRPQHSEFYVSRRPNHNAKGYHDVRLSQSLFFI